MIHYTRLVELKQQELKAIQKDEPLLYKQFATDVDKLDSVFHGLQQQLPKNPNKEQLLEAMLQNLQLQMGLLNHQLDIIKQINHSKKTAYEKAYKTA
jgi:phage shock protein A